LKQVVSSDLDGVYARQSSCSLASQYKLTIT